MLVVEPIAKIRRAHFVEDKSIKQICRALRLSRNTVRKVIRTGATEFTYDRTTQPRPKIDPWRPELADMLAANARRPKRERLTLIRVYEELRNRGYDGSYDAGRMDGSSDAMIAPLAAARRSTTRSTTSRFWRANLEPCATRRRSRSGPCLRPCAVFSASSNDSPAATARWSISSAPCSPMAWMPSKPPVRRPCLTTFIHPCRHLEGVCLGRFRHRCLAHL